MKPARLFLNLNQLYYLLSRFEDLGVDTGPTTIRLETLRAEPSTSNYVSFLAQAQPPKIKSYDTDSIHSVTSVRSLMSGMTGMFSNFSFARHTEKQQAKHEAAAREDVRYLYSAFTKIPCLKISVDHRLKPIAGFEEFPFDTAVPVTIFKNLTSFEVADIDFRSVYGWDVVAENVRSLIVKRAAVDDLSELLHDIVLDDMDQRRRRSSKSPNSPMPLATPSGLPKPFGWPISSSPLRSPPTDGRPRSREGTQEQAALYSVIKKASRSRSPKDTLQARRPSFNARPNATVRRQSGSSHSSSRGHTPRQSSTNLSIPPALPATKWRFLQHLGIPDSGLTSINAESLLPLTDSLHSLDLSSNLFSEIPDALSSLTALRALNLSSCLIGSIRSLARSPLPAVTVLSLKANKLGSLAGIETLKSLQRLDFRDNRLTDPTETARLTGMPDICEIYVKRNPFTTTHVKNRITIFNLFRMTPGYDHDICIDGAGPDRSERKQLANQVPLTSQAIIVDAAPVVDTANERHTSTAVVVKHPAENDQQTSKTPTTPDVGVRPSRRRGAKRRIAEVADQTEAPALDAEPEPPKTVYMSAKEQHPSDISQTGEGQVSQGSPKRQRQVAQHSPPQKQAQSPQHTANLMDRPSMSRELSQSSEVYRQKIEALKYDKKDQWQRARDSPRIRRDPSISPLLQHQNSTGVFSPIKTASIASVQI